MKLKMLIKNYTISKSSKKKYFQKKSLKSTKNSKLNQNRNLKEKFQTLSFQILTLLKNSKILIKKQKKSMNNSNTKKAYKSLKKSKKKNKKRH